MFDSISWHGFTTITKCLYDQTPCLHNRLHKLHLLCANKIVSVQINFLKPAILPTRFGGLLRWWWCLIIALANLNPIQSQTRIVVICRKPNQNRNCFSSACACLIPSWNGLTTITKWLYDQTPCLHNRLHKLHLLCDNKMLSANQMSQTRNTADKVWWPPAPVVVPDHCLG